MIPFNPMCFAKPYAPPVAGLSVGRSNFRVVNGSSGSYTLGWAAGGAAANGTWLVAVVEEATASGTHPYFSGGSAWTRVGTSKCYYKQCGASEPTTYTVSFAGQSKGEGSAACIIEVFGASSVEAAVAASSTNASPTLSPFTTGSLVVLGAGGSGAQITTATPPTGWTVGPRASGNAGSCLATHFPAGSGSLSPGNWDTTYTRLYSLSFKA